MNILKISLLNFSLLVAVCLKQVCGNTVYIHDSIVNQLVTILSL